MSEILGVAGKRANGARTWRVRCANCKREYDSTSNRESVIRAQHCTVCVPRSEFARRARAVMIANGSQRLWDTESARAAGRAGGAARRKRRDALRASLGTGDNRPLWQRVLDQRKAHSCIDTAPTQP